MVGRLSLLVGRSSYTGFVIFTTIFSSERVHRQSHGILRKTDGMYNDCDDADDDEDDDCDDDDSHEIGNGAFSLGRLLE